jgi:hypothetical protein
MSASYEEYEEYEEPKVRVPHLRSRKESVSYRDGEKTVTRVTRTVEKFPSMHKHHHMFHKGKKSHEIGDVNTDLKKEDEFEWTYESDDDDFGFYRRWFQQELLKLGAKATTEVGPGFATETKVEPKVESKPEVFYIGTHVPTHTLDDEIRMFKKDVEPIISLGSVINFATDGGHIAKVHRLALGNEVKQKLREGKRTERTYQDVHEFIDGKKVTKKIQVIVYYLSERQAIADIVLNYISRNQVEVVY